MSCKFFSAAFWSSSSHIWLCKAPLPEDFLYAHMHQPAPGGRSVVHGPRTRQLHPRACLPGNLYLAQVIHRPDLVSYVSLICPITQSHSADSIKFLDRLDLRYTFPRIH